MTLPVGSFGEIIFDIAMGRVTLALNEFRRKISKHRQSPSWIVFFPCQNTSLASPKRLSCALWFALNSASKAVRQNQMPGNPHFDFLPVAHRFPGCRRSVLQEKRFAVCDP